VKPLGRKAVRHSPCLHQRHHVENRAYGEAGKGRPEDRSALAKSDLNRVKESNGIQRNRGAQPEDAYLLHLLQYIE
jgi:hypothetical protein